MKSANFRQSLLQHLEEMVFPDKLAKFQEKHSFLDAKEELLCHWVNYYDQELLTYRPFAEEFSRNELKAISQMTKRLEKLTVEDWAEVQAETKELLTLLKQRN